VRELGLADFVVINTCAVTAEAERKLCQTIRKLRRENPNVGIILTGCASELRPGRYLHMDGVAGIISNKTKLSKSEYLKYAGDSGVEIVNSTPGCQKVRGFLQVQNGCDQKCTYCIVRLTRGDNVSFPEDEVLSQAKSLLNKGYRDIILTGVNISSYGRDQNSKHNLAHLIRYLLKNLPSLTRLGLSSLDPADIGNDLVELIQSEEKLLPHIHESIQSGDDMILKRMMRRHTRHQVIELNERILNIRPDVIFGADLIVGFPTESDEMFDRTKLLVVGAQLSLLHIFPFSPRRGTPAFSMPKVDSGIIKQRAQQLGELAVHILGKKLSEQIGRDLIILAEDQFSGKTNSFLPIKSLNKLVVGREYLFHCDFVDGKIIVGHPISER
jgi:threonylcarbamoyladenosine tRNA methylthiotransferase MtaB